MLKICYSQEGPREAPTWRARRCSVALLRHRAVARQPAHRPRACRPDEVHSATGNIMRRTTRSSTYWRSTNSACLIVFINSTDQEEKVVVVVGAGRNSLLYLSDGEDCLPRRPVAVSELGTLPCVQSMRAYGRPAFGRAISSRGEWQMAAVLLLAKIKMDQNKQEWRWSKAALLCFCLKLLIFFRQIWSC